MGCGFSIWQVIVRLPGNTIFNRYLTKEIVFSFWVSFLLFFVMFLVNQLLVMAEQILAKRVPPLEVGLLILYSMPSVIALTSPFATLIGTLLAANRLSAENEILAMEFLGLSKVRIMMPFVFWGLIFAVGSFAVNDYLMPLGHVNYVRLLRSLVLRVPEIELSPYTVRDYRDVIIVTGEVEKGEVRQFLLFDRTSDNKLRTIMADSARLREESDQAGVISIELSGNVLGIVPDQRRKETFDYFKANKMIYKILLQDIVSNVNNPGPAEMTSADVYKEIQSKEDILKQQIKEREQKIQNLRNDLIYEYMMRSLQSQTSMVSQSELEPKLNPLFQELQREYNTPVIDRNLLYWKLEFYQKFSIPLSCLLFSFVGFPLGLFSRKSGRMIGFGIGLIVSFVYWALLLGARRLSYMVDYDPWMLMFTPNIVLFVSGLILVWSVLKR